MDRVVQKNAANAEETASASTEMNAQADRLKHYIGDLITVMDGTEGRNRDDGGKPAIKMIEGSRELTPNAFR